MIKKNIQSILLFLFCAVILGLSIRGIAGNPTSDSIGQSKWVNNGPFELSPERGRFALTYSIVEDRSFQFSDKIGIFARPDVAVNNGKYVSLFAPLVSFIAVPGYIIGKFLGLSQIGAFAVISIFAILNVLLLRAIAIRLGASPLAASAGSLIFLFATPALPYAVTLYQHHISTFLILLSVYALLKSKRIWTLLVVFFLCAASIPLDYPNLFLMFPIGVFAFGRIISFESMRDKFSAKINLLRIFTLLVMIAPMVFFLWFNKVSYGNPFQLSGALQTTKSLQKPNDLASLSALQSQEREKEAVKKNVVGFFKTRNLLNGFYIHFVSPDRGIIYYAPVVLFGIAGILLAIKKKTIMIPVLIGIIGANILLYSMWGDPWGGWAFGSRYLIPSYAILSIFISLLLTYWIKKIWFLVPFILIVFYSISVNTLGAITTSSLPPQVEILNLEKVSGTIQRYTYQKNWEMLISGRSKSFVYQTYLKKYLNTITFYILLTALISTLVGAFVIYYYLISRKKEGKSV